MAELLSYAIRFPVQTPPDGLRAFFAGLMGLPGPSLSRLLTPDSVVLETISTETGMTHLLSVPRRWAVQVTDHLQAVLPVRLTAVDGDPRPAVTVAVELAVVRGRDGLRVDQPEATTAALLASLVVPAGQALILQWSLRPAAPASRYAQPASASAMFLAVARIGAHAPDPDVAMALVRSPLSVLRSVRQDGTGVRPRVLPGSWAAERLQRRAFPLLWPGTLSAPELAAIAGWPSGSPVAAGLRLGTAPSLPPAPELPQSGRLLLRSNHPSTINRAIAMSAEAGLHHTLLLGATGSGKTTVMLNLARSDMERGVGLIAIDPKADFAHDLLGLVPRRRKADVIYVDPADVAPVGFNVLARRDERLDLAIDQVVRWFGKRFASGWGHRSDDVMRHALSALADAELTLAELPILLSGDECFLADVLRQVTDPGARRFWDWWQALSRAERNTIAAAPLNKARSLLRPRLRAIVGQRDGLNVEQALAERKIVIVSLAKGLIGEDAAGLLGSLLLSRVWSASLGRAALPPDQRHPSFIYVDEAADFLSGETSFGDALAQSRALSVGWIVAGQHLNQLPGPLRHDVLSNCRTQIVFRLAADDAATMGREFGPYLSAADLQALDGYEAAARIFASATTAPPCTGTTIVPPAAPSGWADEVRQASRERWGRDRSAVEAELAARYQASPPPNPGWRRRRP